jgi:hypothetical protein
MMKRALLLAVCVAGGLSGKPTTAATLPKEFTGVWIAAAETDNECKKQDWKGVAGENDRLINITAKAIEEFESGCTIKSVKTSRDSPPGARTSEVNLSCSGEGMTWRSSEFGMFRMSATAKFSRPQCFAKVIIAMISERK